MSVFEPIWVKMICQATASAALALSLPSMAFSQGSNTDSAKSLDTKQVAEMGTPDGIEVHLSEFFLQASSLVGAGNSRQATRLFHIDVLRIFSELAVELNPDSLPAWQLYLQAISLMDPDAAESDASKLKAFEEISRLDPGDEVIRLQRLLFLINEKQTEEERVRGYEVFLEPANVNVIGTKVSARLAFSLAQLLYRTGDIEGYLKYLARSIELDPYFPDATIQAAGYIDSVDPLAKVELLIAALIANPLEAIFAAEIGALALDVGDFSSAARMIGLARSSVQARGEDLSEYALLQARSLWGAGRLEEAERVLSQLKLWLKKTAQRQAKADDPSLTDIQLQNLAVPLDPSRALLQSVLLMESKNLQEHRSFVDETLIAYVLSLETSGFDSSSDPQAVASRSEDLLEMIAFAAWQGEDVDFIDLLTEELSQLVKLTDVQLAAYNGWKKFAGGNYELALETLDSIGEGDQDLLTLLARSLANERLGNTKTAARFWLKIVSESPGSLIGIWARNRLESTLDTVVPQSKQADRLSELISDIPPAVDRILLNRERAYSMLVEPMEDPIGPFDALRYQLTVKNRSGIPLTIGPNGPLKGQIAFLPNYTIIGKQGGIRSSNVVETISRKFSIDPSEVLEFEVNLSTSQLGRKVNSAVLQGSNIGLKVISNFDYDVQAASVVPGLFSKTASSSLLRVDGVPMGKPWRRDALASARSLDGFQSLKDLALLLSAARASSDQDDANTPEMVAFREEVLDLYTAVYSNADEPVRAWLASMVPGGLDFGDFDIINTLIVLDDAPLVVAVTLVNKVWGSNSEPAVKSFITGVIGKRDDRLSDLAKGLSSIIAISDEIDADNP